MNTTPDTPTPRALRELTPLEARILGVLVEKQHTVPDTYPLSLNADRGLQPENRALAGDERQRG